MALVKKIARTAKERTTIHAEVQCDCVIFEKDGRKILQLDTYGSESRQLRGKMSQSLQFDRTGAVALRALLDELLES